MRLKLLMPVLFGLTIAQAQSYEPSQAPIALVYKGPGSCAPSNSTGGCSEAAKLMAEKAGYTVYYVTEKESRHPMFKKATLWIQPGGRARAQTAAMSDDLKEAIVNFVRDGGGYVGFCAGGFMATETFGWDTDNGPFEAKGLGLLKGKSFYYDLYDPKLSDNLLATIPEVQWGGSVRHVYWELGPYFVPQTVLDSRAETIAHYPLLDKPGTRDLDRVMTLRSTFGKGRVYVTAVHPEAPQNWREYYRIQDDDGLDYDLAVDMIKWVTSSNR